MLPSTVLEAPLVVRIGFLLGILVTPFPFGRLLLPLGEIVLVILLGAAGEEPAELRAGEEVPPVGGPRGGGGGGGGAPQRGRQVPADEAQRPGIPAVGRRERRRGRRPEPAEGETLAMAGGAGGAADGAGEGGEAHGCGGGAVRMGRRAGGIRAADCACGRDAFFRGAWDVSSFSCCGSVRRGWRA